MDVATLRNILSGLHDQRPVFHLEADFQFALAWYLKENGHYDEIRLEYTFPEGTLEEGKRSQVDIIAFNDKDTTYDAFELKYKVRDMKWTSPDKEFFDLPNQSAEDDNSFAVCLDLARMEKLVGSKGKPGFQIKGKEPGNAFVIMITNDELYIPQRLRKAKKDNRREEVKAKKVRLYVPFKGSEVPISYNYMGKVKEITIRNDYDFDRFWERYEGSKEFPDMKRQFFAFIVQAKAPESVSHKTLKDIDKSVENLKKGTVSGPVDLSDF